MKNSFATPISPYLIFLWDTLGLNSIKGFKKGLWTKYQYKDKKASPDLRGRISVMDQLPSLSKIAHPDA